MQKLVVGESRQVSLGCRRLAKFIRLLEIEQVHALIAGEVDKFMISLQERWSS